MIKNISEIIENHEKRIRALENKISGVDVKASKGKTVSIKEFLLGKKLKGDVERTLAVGFFLEKYKEYISFNVKDLKESFRAAKEPVPKNINDKANKNIKNGHFMEASENKDNLKAWTLTSSGERQVENGF